MRIVLDHQADYASQWAAMQSIASKFGCSAETVRKWTPRQGGFWDFEHRLRELSEHGDPLERLSATVDFEMFRADLTEALGRRDPGKGGRPGFDPVLVNAD